MKKIVFIAAAALAFCANAAAVNWDVDTINDPSSGSGSTDFLVYFFDANTTGTSVSDANTALASKNVATINAFLANGWQGDLTDDGYSSGVTGDAFANSYEVGGYLVVFNADSVSDATYAFVSGVETGTTGPLGQAALVSFGDLDDSASLSNWTSIAGSAPTPGVPEPTSGLLMLVGLGALALRRRR